ncbi:MAG: Holliday junction resolvase RuvX [Congregibacter sp.]|nr:Holliday junction resolvase RuvX [Congregibacter sp.]MDP5072056.1 Holliday junction resolvase RuvX [Congregibacter sp.]
MSADAAAKRVIAFDYGLSQIGVAVGNSGLGTSQPLAILKARDGQPNWNELSALCKEWQPDLLLVGDPLNMDGTVSEFALRARKFARRLAGRLNLPVTMVDERLSSFDVKQQQKAAGHRGDYREHPIDDLAAELILQDWLRQQ